ncbi:MAG: DUF429 domain-containing protein, partial [Bdellovibrionota bacterium]
AFGFLVNKSQRYIGLELSGAKNNKTAIAALEFYPKEKKIFLLDTYDRITSESEQSSDQALLEMIREIGDSISLIAVNVPLELPPCIRCTRKKCPFPAKCADPSVRHMRQAVRKAIKQNPGPRILEFTPYTQRPIEIWLRYQVLPRIPESARFEIDEALGGNRGPLTARMNFLKRHLSDFSIIEAWPKLSVSILAAQMGLGKRVISSYRHLEQGSHARWEILEGLSKHHGIFIYDRDMRKLSASLAGFDAFICAYTALLSDTGRCTKIPSGFPQDSGWVQFPILDP